MIKPSTIKPDVELRDYLQGTVSVGLPGGTTAPVTVYGDWEKPTNDVPDDFIIVANNGDVGGFGNTVSYADGYLMISLYCKLNDDGTVKKNRVAKLLDQIDDAFIDSDSNEYKNLVTSHYVYKYDNPRFITPTTPSISSGYSVTTLNLVWHTTNNF